MALVSLRTLVNKPGVVYSAGNTDVWYAEDWASLRGAIELGTSGIDTYELYIGGTETISASGKGMFPSFSLEPSSASGEYISVDPFGASVGDLPIIEGGVSGLAIDSLVEMRELLTLNPTGTDGIDANGKKIINLSSPSDSGDAVNKYWVDNIFRVYPWQDSVIDKDLATPPASPSTGDRYIVASGGTGAWTAHDLNVAEWDGSSWVFAVPEEGMTAWVEDENVNYQFNGSVWVVTGSFGAVFQQASSESPTVATNTVYQERLSLITPVIPAGTYRIGWTTEFSTADENTDINIRVQVDDTTTINETTGRVAKNLLFYERSGFKYEVLTSGSHHIDLDFSNSGAKALTIRKTRIEMWRVG